MSELYAAIEKSYLVQGLSNEDIASIAAIATVRSYGAGESILKQFDEGADVMMLLEGEAQILGVIGNPVATIGPSTPFGEMALIDKQPRSATVVAKTAVRVAVVEEVPLRNLLKERPEMAVRIVLNIARVLCERLRATNRQMAALAAIEEMYS